MKAITMKNAESENRKREVRSVMGGFFVRKNQHRTLFIRRASIVVLALSLALCLALASNADAVTAGPNNPSTGANNSSIGSRSWSSTNNVVSSNDSYATVSLSRNQTSNYLMATGFGFSIPTGATINGITVTVAVDHCISLTYKQLFRE